MLTIIFSLFLVTLSWAQDHVGEVVLIRGSGLKTEGAFMKPLNVGTLIYQNDTIKVEPKSFVRILLQDKTLLNIGPISEMKIEEFSVPRKDTRNGVINFIKGQMSAKVKKSGGSLTFKTSQAAMGIRGTELLINHKSVMGKEVSEFALLSGSAVVEDRQNQQYELGARDKVVLVFDPQVGTVERIQQRIEDTEFSALNPSKLDEEVEFKPFMPYFEPSKKRSSGAQAPRPSEMVNLIPRSPAPGAAPSKINEQSIPKSNEKTGNWRNNLDKLNQQLKENQSN